MISFWVTSPSIDTLFGTVDKRLCPPPPSPSFGNEWSRRLSLANLLSSSLISASSFPCSISIPPIQSFSLLPSLCLGRYLLFLLFYIFSSLLLTFISISFSPFLGISLSFLSLVCPPSPVSLSVCVSLSVSPLSLLFFF